MLTTVAFGTAAANIVVCVMMYDVWYPPHDWPPIPIFLGCTNPFAISDCTPGTTDFRELGPG